MSAPPTTDREPCRALLDGLPERVADQPRRADAGRWLAAYGDPALVVTCGGEEPEGLTDTSTCTTVDDVDWYIPDDQLDEPGDLTISTIHRRPVLTVSLPAELWPPASALVDLGPAVRRHLQVEGTCF